MDSSTEILLKILDKVNEMSEDLPKIKEQLNNIEKRLDKLDI